MICNSLSPIFARTLVFIFTILLLSASPDNSIAQSKTAKKPAASKSKPIVEEKAEDEEEPDSKKSNDRDEPEESDEKEEEKKKPDPPKPTPTPEPTTAANVGERLFNVLDPATRSANWGVQVSTVETGQILFQHNADKGFIPASNRKLFTGALALDQLGPDFRYRTYFYRTGTVNPSGALQGNLVVKPSGDPTFNTTLYRGAAKDWVFRDWAAKAKATGIKSVSGSLFIDCSEWDMKDLSPMGWPARVLQDSYAPQTSPLTLNDNLISVMVSPGASGKPGVVSFAPPATGYPVINNTITAKSGRPSIKKTSQGIVVSGNVSKKGQGGQLPVDNPTLFAAANLRHHLLEAGIIVQGSVSIISSRGTIPTWTPETLIAMVESPPLTEINDHMMKQSDNHFAEQVYVSISHAKTGRGGYNHSRRLEADLLARAGIDAAKTGYYDGSGLSESDRVTPDQVCKLLTYMMSHPQREPYFASMAVSGREGTLRNRMGSIAGRVHAKTGTINGVKCLSGYVTISPSQTLAFSFLVNNIRGGSPTGIHDRMCGVLAQLIL